MTMFDVVVLAIVGLSILFAFMRGIVREVIGLAAWIGGLVLAFMYAAPAAAAFARPDWSPAVLQVLAFAAIFAAVLLAGAVLGRSLARAIQAVGLSPVDRGLGALFGLARGLAIVLLGVLAAGLTGAPRAVWWQKSLLAPALVAAALQVRDWLPGAWAHRLDYSPGATGSLQVRVKQEDQACAES